VSEHNQYHDAAGEQPQPASPKPKPRWFFIRRRPRLRGVPLERDLPLASSPDYAEQLVQEGFVSPSQIDTAVSQELIEDLRELEEHLLPHFWRMDQQARYYQNRYYLFQWVFILSAFAITAISAFSVYLYGHSSEVVLRALGIMAAIIGGLAATISFLGANQSPQDRWFKARSQAESLRSLYFLYLARQIPFNMQEPSVRLDMLRFKVVDVLKEFYVDDRRRNG
jgi:hypothetical protein